MKKLIAVIVLAGALVLLDGLLNREAVSESDTREEE